jgi:flagellar hook capping protein FlgD/dockerin type I repeat protein
MISSIPTSPNDMTSVLFAEVGKGVSKDGKMSVLLSFPVNGEATYGVAASTGTVVSTVGLKAGEMPVATLVDGAAKAAENVLVSSLATAVGGPMDNIAPAAVTAVKAVDNAGTGTGILVSWTASVDDAVVGTFGASGQYPIYGVDEYAVYRNGELTGTVTRGMTSFVDASVADGSTAYKYMVKSIDDSGIDVSSGIRTAIATSDLTGDLNGDAFVNLSDFAIFGANYGKAEADSPENYIWAYDLNGDGVVDLSDFAIFGANYGTTLQVAKGIAAELPTADVMMAMSGEFDDATSTYKLHVNVGQDIDGFEFLLSYDTNNLEFTGDVTGLVGLPFASETEEGVVTIANAFIGEKFNGTVTLSFNTLSDYDDMIFSIDNALVFDGVDLAKVTDIAEFEAKPVPTVYTLSQNFPNPFNPTTTINYAIPQTGQVELAIFNTAGQKVRTLVAQEQSAGFYKMVWDGRNEMGESVASGVYIYRLHSGSFSKTAKMNLIK